jgi:hypothetical protein
VRNSTTLLLIARGQIPHARGNIHGEVREAIQPRRQSLEIVFVAPLMASHLPQLRVAHNHTIASLEDVLPGGRIGFPIRTAKAFNATNTYNFYQS